LRLVVLRLAVLRFVAFFLTAFFLAAFFFGALQLLCPLVPPRFAVASQALPLPSM